MATLALLMNQSIARPGKDAALATKVQTDTPSCIVLLELNRLIGPRIFVFLHFLLSILLSEKLILIRRHCRSSLSHSTCAVDIVDWGKGGSVFFEPTEAAVVVSLFSLPALPTEAYSVAKIVDADVEEKAQKGAEEETQLPSIHN
ncbi:uncharacterized protein G2W53_041483 [Senna tora]|uniref:Uncharacterized protein n=1 Tax=Senna tora TaxID=362788 RepID=A0A834VYU0_9FABA|nr:uncharacterized protein G2W53_041483 [Senna tora]